MHPLLRLITTQPDLIVDHAEAYAELVTAEIGKASNDWKRRVMLNGVAICSLGAALVLAGVALMFWATIPASDIHAPWILIVAPLAPAVLGVGCLVAARSRDGNQAFDDLRRQMSADMAMLREADAA